MTYHYQRQEDAWPHLFEQNIRQWLKDGVTNEENRKGGIVLAISHAQILLEAVDFGVADVRSVKEGYGCS